MSMKYTPAVLNSMIPAELEAVRESGDEERRQLSDAVMNTIPVPPGWRVNAEYRCEFGGQFPVQLRFAPERSDRYFLCLCSPGEMLPAWTLFLLAADGGLVRILSQSDRHDPVAVSALLAQVAGLHRINCSAATIAELMNAEVMS
ncbi:UNVERIFIED_ORG: hypothetical protein QE398_000050 [Atlantibacter sp. SORGH_AS 304]|nr:hypothetical protein [Atlantibacter sp. SORGH_AS_0304]